MKHRGKRLLNIWLSIVMVLGMLPGMNLTVMAEEGGVNTKTYGDHTFTKVSNPSTGAKEADGINTNDVTGYAANRLNSYAWAVTSRGDSIYIGTNRTLFGSALNAVAENQQSEVLTKERLQKAVTLLTGGEVPVELEEEDYIPQIIKFDVENNSTKVIYQPQTKRGEDGRLYYCDKEGNIIPNADVESETASYRSVIQFKGNMYFGSLGSNMLQLVRVDENDNAAVVYQTIGLTSSLRAGCAHDAGDGETIYFGGQDTTYIPWRRHRQQHPEDTALLPIVIRYLNPDTAGTDNEDWSGLIADYNDFGQYARASVYKSGGGNVWDLCSYNGKLYLILAYDGGWALFRGEKGGANPNQFGWTWTEIVGDNGKYPLAMNPEVAVLNEQYREAYSGSEYAPGLTGTGLLESTATPYVYNGKMYIGSFDNATAIQSQTVLKALVKFKKLMDKESWKELDFGPTLTQIFAPIYEVLSHPQHVWVMDADENITAVDSANALLDGTTNDYVWRFIEHDGKLYTGTFDSSTAYIYFLDLFRNRFVSMLEENKEDLPETLQLLLDGTFSEKLRSLLIGDERKGKRSAELEESAQKLALRAGDSAEAFMDNDASVEQLLESMTALAEVREELEENMKRIAEKEADKEDEESLEEENAEEQVQQNVPSLTEENKEAEENNLTDGENAENTEASIDGAGSEEQPQQNMPSLAEENKESEENNLTDGENPENTEEGTENKSEASLEGEGSGEQPQLRMASLTAVSNESEENNLTDGENTENNSEETPDGEGSDEQPQQRMSMLSGLRKGLEESILNVNENEEKVTDNNTEVTPDGEGSEEQLQQSKSLFGSLSRKRTENNLAADDEKDTDEGEETLTNCEKALEMIDWLLEFFDIEGLKYWAKARKLAKNAEQGFDLFVTSDGTNWNKVVGDGLKDPYNYGARTFTILNDELYVGTANPYYGAQLWRITESDVPEAEIVKAPRAIENLVFDGTLQELVTAGKAKGGTMYYALGKDAVTEPAKGYSASIPAGFEPGTYYVWYKAVGDEHHTDSDADVVIVNIANSYYVHDGNDQTWYKGTSNGLIVTFKARFADQETYEKWDRTVAVDGREIGRNSYDAKSGSLMIKLHPSYLEKLSVGKHYISVSFTDGEAAAVFSIKAKGSGKEKESGGSSSSSSSSSSAGSVVTCQMAGYPSNYTWNEAAKACQAGYLDANGVFHSTAGTAVRSGVPNTYDKGLMSDAISFSVATIVAVIAAGILKKNK